MRKLFVILVVMVMTVMTNPVVHAGNQLSDKDWALEYFRGGWVSSKNNREYPVRFGNGDTYDVNHQPVIIKKAFYNKEANAYEIDYVIVNGNWKYVAMINSVDIDNHISHAMYVYAYNNETGSYEAPYLYTK